MEKAPDSYKSPPQEMVYESLTKLQISFERVNTDESFSMEDVSRSIKIGCENGKNLRICEK